MKDHQRARLKWFLKFLNADLESISESERVKMATELILALGEAKWDGVTETISLERYNFYAGNRGAELKHLQEEFRIFFEGLWGKLQASASDLQFYDGQQVYEPNLSEIKSLVEIEPRVTLSLAISLEESPEVVWAGGASQPQSVIWPKGAFNKAQLELRVSSARNEDAILFNFLMALDGLPLSALEQCKECRGWFLRVSKRQRFYCSNRCAAKRASRERYKRIKEEDAPVYEQELVEGRERAHKSYSKKIKKAFPTAKVERRPRIKSKNEP